MKDPHKAKEVGGSSTQEIQEDSDSEEEEPMIMDKGKGKLEEKPQEYVPKIPFPHALRPKVNKKIPVQQEELMRLFKQVNINIPLLDAIKHVSTYAKFLKDLCTPKRESKEATQKIRLSEDINVVVMNHLPKKLKDPEAPLISCDIGGITLERALLDLGASVNLLPTFIYE